MNEQRHEARTTQTFVEFIRDLAQSGHFSEQDAVRYAACVLYRLEERLTAGESFNLESQLPLKLRELVPAPPDRPEDGGPVRKYHFEDFVGAVAGDLGIAPVEAEPIIRHVFATIRLHISGGEADGVAHHLPSDLKPLWCDPI